MTSPSPSQQSWFPTERSVDTGRHHEHLPDDYIPFGELVSRWFLRRPPVRALLVLLGPKCQAPAFVPAHTMGIQFSFYSGDSAKGFPTVGTPGTYDIWVDDVQFTTMIRVCRRERASR